MEKGWIGKGSREHQAPRNRRRVHRLELGWLMLPGGQQAVQPRKDLQEDGKGTMSDIEIGFDPKWDACAGLAMGP
jgi:hypothetical protein